MDLETQGVLMWTGFISLQAQVRSCEYAEETLGSILCGKLLHKLKDTMLHEMLCHVIQNSHSCRLEKSEAETNKTPTITKPLHAHTYTHTQIYIYIQGVPGGMCETSGECSLC